MQWCRKAADMGYVDACLQLAFCMYIDRPHAREVGRVGEAAGVGMSASEMVGHDVTPDVLTSVAHWVQRGGQIPDFTLSVFRRQALEGGRYCFNDGCEVVGHLKDFKVCPQCKTARYCGAECQKHDWTTGGHKERCGTTRMFDSTA